MVWDHKTAPTIEIDSVTAKKQFGRKHRYGPRITFAQQEGMFGVAEEMQDARELHELGERLRREAQGAPESNAEVEPVLAHPARCHPSRPRMGPVRLSGDGTQDAL
jgi:hypothetical protein